MAQSSNKAVNASPAQSKSGSTEQQQKLRRRIIEKLGSCCVSCGLKDVRVLQIDHVHGGGQKEMRRGLGAGMSYYYRVLRDETGKFQLLCANCNWIKRVEEKEATGNPLYKAKA